MLECSWPCSRAHARARLHLVVACSTAVELVLVLECSLLGVLTMMSHETEAHVISRTLNVANVVRHFLVMEGISPILTCETCDHFKYNKIQSP